MHHQVSSYSEDRAIEGGINGSILQRFKTPVKQNEIGDPTLFSGCHNLTSFSYPAEDNRLPSQLQATCDKLARLPVVAGIETRTSLGRNAEKLAA